MAVPVFSVQEEDIFESLIKIRDPRFFINNAAQPLLKSFIIFLSLVKQGKGIFILSRLVCLTKIIT